MLTTLLIGLLHAAPPPPRSPADPPQPARIEGLRSTWVTPATWVPSLRPGRPIPTGPVIVTVHLQESSNAEAIGAAVRAHERVEQVQVEGQQLMVFLSAWADLSSLPLDDGARLGHLADLAIVPRPTGVPLPGSSTSPAHPTAPGRPPIALPGSSTSPFRPGDAPSPADSEHTPPEASPQRARPWPPPAPTDEATGWNLVIHNPYLGGPSRLSIETLGLGEADPDTTIVLHDVQPGVYAVTFTTPSGAERTRPIATVRPDAP